MALFTIENLTFTYPAAAEAVLKNINLTVNNGDFVVICGKSGSGKSTLLRHFKTELTPAGNQSGRIFFYNKSLDSVSQREQAQRIGFVMQNPDNQIVTDKVWHELAFGLESLGTDEETIRLRTAETASFFGMQNLFDARVDTLSGGQKQLLNLAAVMAMQPEVLILDEPTSRLDPIAAGEFLEAVKRINRELGTTVIIAEHRLEDVLAASNKAVVMAGGKIIIDEAPEKAAAMLDSMGVDKIVCSEVCDGCGTIECSHGIIPVPVPAVKAMMDSCDYVFKTEPVSTELVTPSGLGMLIGMGAECAPRPEGSIIAKGIGYGGRDTGRGGMEIYIIEEE